MTTSPVLQGQRRDLIKFVLFMVVAVLFTVWVAAVTGEVRMRDTHSYRASFADVSGLQTGDQVRVAGVNVGTVRKIDVQSDSSVLVTFDVDDAVRLNEATNATIQYRNLIGDRIVSLSRSTAASPELPRGATIPRSKTASALDLDTLLNGFKPLFAGLNPAQVNEVSEQLIRVLQGQESALSTLVQHVGSFTSTIADREELVGSVIANLNTVLGTVDANRETVGELITNLSTLTEGVESQDTQLLDAAARVNTLADEAASLVGDARTDLHADLVGLRDTAQGLNTEAVTLRAVIAGLPKHYEKIQNTASYGNFFNFFLCGVRLQAGSSQAPLVTPWIYSDVARCKR
ncbi:MCE family protein [Nocardioides sp. Bht2]|uniref:MCE family protein n=1 Tax=Nocardioides sp. Bht2 TaxID=3392297 RepID=UPI0039B51714